jgi:NAD(P)-dependent dehydrogenase (short-subunit alcohol dehydrogenase family)
VDAARISLDGRVVVVSRGGTGIGRGTAKVLAEFGADLVLAARRPEPLERAALSAAWSMGRVRVNRLTGRAVKTETSIETAHSHGLDEDAFGARSRMARVGLPDELLFFASDASSFVSGQTLWIDGGPQAHSHP